MKIYKLGQDTQIHKLGQINATEKQTHNNNAATDSQVWTTTYNQQTQTTTLHTFKRQNSQYFAFDEPVYDLNHNSCTVDWAL